ncbi:MAG TPA: M20 family metallopeptidase [Candidatus Acidoferrales bacterium]|nr:M20 family metallopeptidase [Candidatus Acidoferrales bacterium]
MTHLLGRFVRAESPTFDKPAVDCFGSMVAAEWKRRGAHVEVLRQRERGNHLRAIWPPGRADARRQILVLGHLDTVYELGTLARMPFRTSGGRAWGPGTLDMKSGLVIALFAVEALARLGLHPQKRVVFLWTSDEEIGSKTSRASIEKEARRSDAALVLEPGTGPEGWLKTARKGVGEIELVVTGRAAHAGINPGDGVNAVHELALQIARILRPGSRFNDERRGITASATVVGGGTRTNVIAEQARALVDLRVIRRADMRAVERKFRRLRPILPGARLEVCGGFTRPPMEGAASRKLFRRAQALAGEMGLKLQGSFSGGGSDGNFTAALGVPTLDGLGGVGEGAHSPGEYVLLRALPERAALLGALLAAS